MQRVLSRDLWKIVRLNADRARQRQGAIAYVTRDLVGFRRGDVLVMDASPYAISNGETDAHLLRKLYRKGVCLYHCDGLHAKVLLFDSAVLIGSGNMSHSSANDLVEAGVLTDQASTVAGAASLIEQLVQQSDPLTEQRIAKLCRIKVVRRGGRQLGSKRRRTVKISRLGDRTWLVGIRQLVRDPAPDEARMIAKAVKAVRSQRDYPDYEPDWIRWSTRNRFTRECREGDSVIQIWRSNKAKQPSCVYAATPVLLKQPAKKWTRFYLGIPAKSRPELSWGRFQRLLKQLGYAKRVGPGTALALDSDFAEALARAWKGASKS